MAVIFGTTSRFAPVVRFFDSSMRVALVVQLRRSCRGTVTLASTPRVRAFWMFCATVHQKPLTKLES
ncbi:hypothetical protein D9M71_809360 [compost metagenome]